MARFVDTNILLYAVSVESKERAKRELAIDILQSTDLTLSAQVLAEFYAQSTRLGRPGALLHRDASEFITGLTRYPVRAVTAELVLAAASTHERYRISYWDAAIVEAARAQGCDTVLTEDLQHDMDFDGVRIENPFHDL